MRPRCASSREVKRLGGRALSSHLVVVGGIAWNDATRRTERDAAPAGQASRGSYDLLSGEIFVTDPPPPGARYEPHWLNEDPGKPGKARCAARGCRHAGPGAQSLQRTAHPDLLQRHPQPRGPRRAVRCLTDPAVRDDNERYLREMFPRSDSFAVLMRVPVPGGHTISPSLSSAGSVLFEWPAATLRRLDTGVTSLPVTDQSDSHAGLLHEADSTLGPRYARFDADRGAHPPARSAASVLHRAGPANWAAAHCHVQPLGPAGRGDRAREGGPNVEVFAFDLPEGNPLAIEFATSLDPRTIRGQPGQDQRPEHEAQPGPRHRPTAAVAAPDVPRRRHLLGGPSPG